MYVRVDWLRNRARNPLSPIVIETRGHFAGMWELGSSIRLIVPPMPLFRMRAKAPSCVTLIYLSHMHTGYATRFAKTSATRRVKITQYRKLSFNDIYTRVKENGFFPKRRSR